MSDSVRSPFETEPLMRLDFLVGEYRGWETLYPPGHDPVQFEAALSASRESCDRFLRVEYFAEIPKFGIETLTVMISWSDKRQCFRGWIFSVLSEEPTHFEGNFEGDKFILLSDPVDLPWGLQRLRNTFTPLAHGGYEMISERWEPDGYKIYCSVNFRPAF